MAEEIDQQVEKRLVEDGVQSGRIAEAPEEDLGTRIQAAREAKRLTQGDLADLTKSLDPDQKGMSRAVISLYESGKNRPGPKEIRLLCEALRVTPNHLIYGRDEPFDDLADAGRLGSHTRRDPEGYAWMAHVIYTLHHNHYDAIMKLALDLQRGWNKKFDQGLQDEANAHLLQMAEELQNRLNKRKAAK